MLEFPNIYIKVIWRLFPLAAIMFKATLTLSCTGAFQGPGTTQSSSPAPGSITAVVRDQNLGYIHSTPPTSVVNAPTWNPQPAPRSVSPAAPAPDAPSPSSGSPQSDMKDIPVTMVSHQYTHLCLASDLDGVQAV